MTIKEALLKLNPENEGQWTEDGFPVVAVVAEMIGDDTVTREVITQTDPEFCRDKAKVRNTPNAVQQSPKEQKKDPEITPEALLRDLGRLKEQRTVLDRQIKAIEADYSALVAYREKLLAQQSPTETSIAYVRQQAKLRAERARQRNSLLQNLDPASLSPKAPIDQAMERKIRRGTNRPGFNKPSPDPKKG